MHSSKHQACAVETNGLAAGRLGHQADHRNPDFIAQPFCLSPRGDTLSVTYVTSPYCDITSWHMKFTHMYTFVWLSSSVALAASDDKGLNLQVAVSGITLVGRKGITKQYKK